MTTVVHPRPHPDPLPRSTISSRPWWLWFSLPIAVCGMAASVCGLAVDRIYAEETANWRAQAVGQDIANLVVLTVMLVLAGAAARGSARALLAWAGTAVYAAYTYAIYAFAMHFGPLFLVHVAVLGLAAWALIGFFASIDPAQVRAAFPPEHRARFVSTFLLVLAGGFAVLWILADLPAMISGTPPQEVRETGLLTNPVHVLDLALFLPAAITAGVLLRRRRAWGHVLAPVVLTAMAGISLGIVTLSLVAVARDLGGSLVLAAVIGAIGVLQAVVSWRFLHQMASSARTGQVLRPQGSEP